MLTLLALTTLVHAQPEADLEPGYLVLHPTPGTELRRFPRYRADRVHLTLRGNTARLDAQLQGRSARWLHDVEVWDSGGGTWYVTLYLTRDDLDVSWEWQEDAGRPRVLLTLEQAGPSVESDSVVDVGIEELVTDAVPREHDPSRGAAFHPMDGDALNPVLDPSAYAASWPRWEPDVPARYKVLGYDLSPRASLVGIDRFRALLTETDDPRVHALALWRLAEAHQDMGLHREALSYFSRLAELESAVGIDAERVQLARAQAAFGSHRWDVARDACAGAWRAGAHDALVLECLGVSALATGHPAPAATGRQLAEVAASSRARLLAGQLLLQDHRFAEAIAPLTRAVAELDGDLWVVATMNLGDAHLHLGQLDEARAVWRTLTAELPKPAVAPDTGLDGEEGTQPLSIDDPTRELRALVDLRYLVHQLVQDAPLEWANTLAEVLPLTVDEGIVGAEALYVAAQLQERLDEPAAAAGSLRELARRYPRIAARTDAADRLARVWRGRVMALAAGDRHADLAAFHQATWHPALLSRVEDTAPLEAVVRAWREMGAAEEALKAQRLVHAVHTQQGRQDPEQLMETARLYGEVDRAEEALETVAFIRRLPGATKELGGRLDLLEGDLQASLWQLEPAERAWRRAQRDAGTRLAAMVRLARVAADAGRCAEAVTLLAAVHSDVAAASLPEVADGRAHLVAARCQLALGDYDAALQSAAESARLAVEPVHQRYALYLAARAAEQGRLPAPIPEEVDGDGVWTALLREEQAQSSFTAEVDSWYRR